MRCRANEHYQSDHDRPSFVSVAKRCVVFKLNAVGKCFVNWTAFDDLSKPLTLCVIEVTFDMNVACNSLNETPVRNIAILAVVHVNAIKIVGSAYRFQRQILELAVPGNGHAGTCGKRSEQQLIGIRAGIGAAGVDGLVGLPLVPSI